MSSFLIKRGPMHALLPLSLLKVILIQADFFSQRTLSRIALAANNFKPTYICVLNNRSKKPPCSQIKPTFEQRGPVNSLNLNVS